jgi:hypothetical protein
MPDSSTSAMASSRWWRHVTAGTVCIVFTHGAYLIEWPSRHRVQALSRSRMSPPRWLFNFVQLLQFSISKLGENAPEARQTSAQQL